MSNARDEAEMVMYPVVEAALKKTGAVTVFIGSVNRAATAAGTVALETHSVDAELETLRATRCSLQCPVVDAR